MAAFQFPDPADQQTVVNPITGSTYQWKEPPGKWVVTVSIRQVEDIIWEGDNPPDPIGDYKLWYSTDTLELYFHYCDVNGVCAWVPTSAPITMLEDLDTGLAEVKADVIASNIAINENTNRIANIVEFSDTEPPTYPDEAIPQFDDEGNDLLDADGNPVIIYEFNDLNHKFWLDTESNELYILRLADPVARTYEYQPVSGAGGANIYYGDYQPVEDTYELWYDTTRLELYVNYEGMWFPANPGVGGGEETEELAQNLEQVLTEGNVADQSIVLTNAENDAILLNPDEARVMVGGFGEDVVPVYELRHTDSMQDSAVVKLELDEGGTRFDIECDEKVSNIHFRFGDEAKLDINKKGDAVFEGKVQVQPGTTANEVVTYQQLQEIEEELEDIRPSLERGVWAFESDNEPGIGNYSLLRTNTQDYCEAQYFECISEDPENPEVASRCLRALTECTEKPAYPIDDWLATEIVTNNTDSNGVTHQWPDAEVGEFLEFVNEDGSGFALYQLTELPDTEYNGTTKFTVTYIRSNGAPNAKTKVKLYAISEEIDPTEFVHKTGDTMTGQLVVAPDSGSAPSVELKPAPDAPDARGVIFTRDRNNQVSFLVTAGGSPRAGSEDSPFMAEEGRDLTTKKYVDEQDKKLIFKAGTNVVEKDFGIRTSSSSFISIGDELKLYNVATPTSDGDAATKAYVDKETAIQSRQGPARLAWRWQGEINSSNTPEDGGFYKSGSSPEYLRLSFKSANNIDLGDDLFSDVLVQTGYGPIATVWKYNEEDNKWQLMMQLRIEKFRWNYKDHHEYEISSRHGRKMSDLVVGQLYYITIGGFF